ncbi:hypothetical protein ONZ45_g5814 [Pleurotus djamor]|nr:hypothetical protein ONZ45_g5814 [Pleurotus djamor]
MSSLSLPASLQGSPPPLSSLLNAKSREDPSVIKCSAVSRAIVSIAEGTTKKLSVKKDVPKLWLLLWPWFRDIYLCYRPSSDFPPFVIEDVFLSDSHKIRNIAFSLCWQFALCDESGGTVQDRPNLIMDSPGLISCAVQWWRLPLTETSHVNEFVCLGNVINMMKRIQNGPRRWVDEALSILGSPVSFVSDLIAWTRLTMEHGSSYPIHECLELLIHNCHEDFQAEFIAQNSVELVVHILDFLVDTPPIRITGLPDVPIQSYITLCILYVLELAPSFTNVGDTDTLQQAYDCGIVRVMGHLASSKHIRRPKPEFVEACRKGLRLLAGRLVTPYNLRKAKECLASLSAPEKVKWPEKSLQAAWDKLLSAVDSFGLTRRLYIETRKCHLVIGRPLENALYVGCSTARVPVKRVTGKSIVKVAAQPNGGYIAHLAAGHLKLAKLALPLIFQRYVLTFPEAVVDVPVLRLVIDCTTFAYTICSTECHFENSTCTQAFIVPGDIKKSLKVGTIVPGCANARRYFELPFDEHVEPKYYSRGQFLKMDVRGRNEEVEARVKRETIHINWMLNGTPNKLGPMI